MKKVGIPPENLQPDRYSGPRANLTPCLEVKRRPSTLDRDYSLLTLWRVSSSPSTGEEGEVWQLVRFESNGDATWRRIDYSSYGPGLDTITVDAITAPGVNPVDPNGVGNVNILGTTVAAHSVPVETRSRALNGLNVEIQAASARTGAPTDMLDTGLSSYDNTIFSADANGWVSLVGGSIPPSQTFTVDHATLGAANPVVPSATGGITISGNTVAAHNVAIETHTSAANSFGIDLQVAAALTATPSDKNDVGVASFDNQYFTASAHGFVSVADRLLQYPIGTTINLGIAYSSPTFTVKAADGTDLSATNPAWVVLPSVSNPGQKIAHKITSNISFQDDSGTSDLTGNLWGTTTAIDWDSAMPFFIYGVVKDSDVDATFMISRVPHRTSAPVSANIAKSGSAVASTQGSFFAIDSSITVGDYDGNPCAVVGSFRMTKNDAANDDWTVTTLAAQDGVGRFQEGQTFSFPLDQNGASSNGLSSSNGGDTIPTMTSIGRFYSISKDGYCNYLWNWANISSGGVGAGTLRFHVPYENRYSVTWVSPTGNLSYVNNGASTYTTLMPRIYNLNTYFEAIFTGTGTAKLTPADLSTDKAQGSFNVNYFINI